MSYKIPQPIVTVRLRRSTAKNSRQQIWNLTLEIINIVRNGKYTTLYESVHRSITTPIWNKKQKTPRGNYQPKRNDNGIIQCESEQDQEACIYADKLRQKRQHDFEKQSLYDGYEEKLIEMETKKQTDVVTYFQHVAVGRHPNSEKKQYGWMHAAYMLETFVRGKHLYFKDIDMRFINDYRSYLLNLPNKLYKKNKNVKVSSNTAGRYFMFFRAMLHQAFNEGYIDVDLASKTTAIKKTIALRDAFTLGEIERLANTPCVDENLKRAALFSCLTGLRLGDLRQLRWNHIKYVNGAWRVDFVQSKTQVTDYLPISKQALEICGEPQDGEDEVFPNLKITAYFKPALNKWLKKAGITRHMTFQCFRHTFATLQLESGTDIYTIKSMLGHTSVKTTMLYSHIVDGRKREAVDDLFIEGLDIN